MLNYIRNENNPQRTLRFFANKKRELLPLIKRKQFQKECIHEVSIWLELYCLSWVVNWKCVRTFPSGKGEIRTSSTNDSVTLPWTTTTKRKFKHVKRRRDHVKWGCMKEHERESWLRKNNIWSFDSFVLYTCSRFQNSTTAKFVFSWWCCQKGVSRNVWALFCLFLLSQFSHPHVQLTWSIANPAAYTLQKWQWYLLFKEKSTNFKFCFLIDSLCCLFHSWPALF